MKIRLTGDISGTRNGDAWPPRGSEIELPDDEAAALCALRMAVPVVDDKVETAAVKDDSEKRAKPTRRR